MGEGPTFGTSHERLAKLSLVMNAGKTEVGARGLKTAGHSGTNKAQFYC